ncbi:Acetyltransferase (GNAT) domain-containing protein [Daejeonella rubra]|uniref:Acetyltransferase (GNAT) domain-containing protein n=1 Tax=Daejeonella rubra TaxID=990371 RepID=A0A1G9X976_9SPHI|nr:GNAT family N-acetyltransferase [Daejeonella rubra]SDM93320.1 Acetyltransferase (GNAT) domain-containing protein [Daejeonella rubra]
MKIQTIDSRDIDLLNILQPQGWEDIRPYFYYYISSPSCDPIKISIGNKIAAVGTTIRHPDTAWLAHVIVHPDFRNQGLGQKLTEALIGRLDYEKIKTVYLDATDMGFPVYRKIGFEVETEYIHLDGELINQNLKDPAAVIPFQEKYRDKILQLDKQTSGENRGLIINDHLKSSLIYLKEGIVSGVYFPHFFEQAIIANDPEAGTELMKLRMRIKNKFRFPLGNQSGINFLIQNNYQKMRTSRKMILGLRREYFGEFNYNRISGGLG